MHNLIKKSLILITFFFSVMFAYADVQVQVNGEISQRFLFSNISSYSLINNNNKKDFDDYLKTNPKANIGLNISLNQFFYFSAVPYMFLDVKRDSKGNFQLDKNLVGMKEFILKFFYLPAGIQFEFGKFFINNTIGNLFTPFNYFENYMDVKDPNIKEFDSSLPFTAAKGNFFHSFDNYSFNAEVLWLPGLNFVDLNGDGDPDDKMSEIYFVKSIVNYTNKNLFQYKISFDCFDGWYFGILMGMFEKEPYNFNEGFYYIFGVNSSVRISDRVLFYQEATVSNGQSYYVLKTTEYPTFPKGMMNPPVYKKLSQLEEKKDSMDTRFYLEYSCGLNILLPGDVSLILEYFYNDHGYPYGKASKIYNAIEQQVNQDKGETKDYLAIQGTYLQSHKINKFSNNYFGIEIDKTNIANKLTLIGGLKFCPTELGFASSFMAQISINDYITINSSLIVTLGLPKTEYGLELYNVYYNFEIVFQFNKIVH